MSTSDVIPITNAGDADLVTQVRRGDQDAFREIVDRHKTLICSLAYSATGDLVRSEELAHETFVTAWKRMPGLREPAKLRSWLCGIARFVIGHDARRRRRKPLHEAESLSLTEAMATDSSPADQAITVEETALLWRALEQIPEPYRETLILFYREHQSVDRVAVALGATEDAVKQRLARGRRMLQEQVVTVVEGALARTAPGPQFTLGVMAAVHAVVAGGSVAAAGGVAKGGTVAKALGGAVGAGAIAWLIITFSILGFLIALGACLGYVMSRAIRRSAVFRHRSALFWRAIAVAMFGGVVLPYAVAALVPGGAGAHPRVFTLLSFVVALVYPTVVAAAAWWFAGWARGSTLPMPGREPLPAVRRWLAIGMIVPTFGFGYLVYDVALRVPLMSGHLAPEAARQIIATRTDAHFEIEVTRRGHRMLEIRLPEDGRRVVWYTAADPALLALLAQKGVDVRTRVEGQDYAQLGWPWQKLGLIALFLGPAALVSAARLPRYRQLAVAEPESPADRAESRAARWFELGAKGALVVLAGVLAFAAGVTLLHR